jgi:hypothetical protein
MIWESLYFIGLLAMSAAIGRDSKAHCLNDLMGRIRDLQAHSFSQRSLWQKLNDSSSDQHLSVRAKGDSVWLSGIISLAIKQGRSVHEFLFQFERRLLEV